jgi:sec-independent protein translocase protein TatA
MIEGMGEFQPTHILLIAFVALLLFGGGRVADLGKGLGQALKNFKAGLREGDEEPHK